MKIIWSPLAVDRASEKGSKKGSSPLLTFDAKLLPKSLGKVGPAALNFVPFYLPKKEPKKDTLNSPGLRHRSPFIEKINVPTSTRQAQGLRASGCSVWI